MTQKTADRIHDIASRLVTKYHQNWGQPTQDRVDALNEAVAAAGIKAKLIQDEGVCGWECEDPFEAKRARKFRAKLAKVFPKGQFELEVSAASEIIEDTLQGRDQEFPDD